MARALRTLHVFFAGGIFLLAALGTCGSAVAAISPATLEAKIGTSLSRIREFAFIQDQARALGFHAWIFGGTSAALAHYVRRDEERLAAGRSDPADYFDYELDHLLRPSQDIDVVIDGTPEQARALQAALEASFPRTQGESKSAWEVRLLSEPLGAKEALLGNPAILKQHSDSMSNALIELSDPAPGVSRIRDLRATRERNPFLEDAAVGRIDYFFSSEHGQTPRAVAGQNPSILSVLRILAKSFQYGLEIPASARRAMAKVIAEFNPQTDLTTPYARARLEHEAKKILTQAIDLEAAWNELEALGLRTKLIAAGGDLQRAGTLAWWMDREPLRSWPLETPSPDEAGKLRELTAGGLGIARAAHETQDPLVYFNWHADPGQLPNVFISRKGVAGEAALYGIGFYASVGAEGGRGSGYTLRFEVDPRAREGVDFAWRRAPRAGSSGFKNSQMDVRPTGPVLEGDYLIFYNRQAIRRVFEPLEKDPLALVRSILGTEDSVAQRGYLERNLRRLTSLSLSPAEKRAIHAMISEKLAGPNPSLNAIGLGLRVLPKWAQPQKAWEAVWHDVGKLSQEWKKDALLKERLLEIEQMVPRPADVVHRLLQLFTRDLDNFPAKVVQGSLDRLGSSAYRPEDCTELASVLEKNFHFYQTRLILGRQLSDLARMRPEMKPLLLRILWKPKVSFYAVKALEPYAQDPVIRAEMGRLLNYIYFSPDARLTGVRGDFGDLPQHIYEFLGWIRADEQEIGRVISRAVRENGPEAEKGIRLLRVSEFNDPHWGETLEQVLRTSRADLDPKGRGYSLDAHHLAAQELARLHHAVPLARRQFEIMLESWGEQWRHTARRGLFSLGDDSAETRKALDTLSNPASRAIGALLDNPDRTASLQQFEEIWDGNPQWRDNRRAEILLALSHRQIDHPELKVFLSGRSADVRAWGSDLLRRILAASPAQAPAARSEPHCLEGALSHLHGLPQ